MVQSGGTLSADGLVKLDGGRLDFLGGTINGSGTFQARNAVLNIDAGVTAASTIQVIGGSNVLLDNASPAVTLWVAGDDVGDNQGVLTAVPGAINAGTIELQSLGTHWDSFLAIDDTLVNTPTGVIEANAGAGDLPAGLINEGLLAVAADNPIEIHGSYVAAGGQITGPGSLYSVTLSITAATATPTMLVLHGSSTLLTDNLANMTLWLQGNSQGDATLSTPGDVTNNGTILLESLDGSDANAVLSLGGSLENLGSIEAAGGAGGPTIGGDVFNLGTISVAAGSSLRIASGNPAGPSFTQLAGSITADGQLFLDGGFFDFEGGTLSGDFLVARHGPLRFPRREQSGDDPGGRRKQPVGKQRVALCDHRGGRRSGQSRSAHRGVGGGERRDDPAGNSGLVLGQLPDGGGHADQRRHRRDRRGGGRRRSARHHWQPGQRRPDLRRCRHATGDQQRKQQWTELDATRRLD